MLPDFILFYILFYIITIILFCVIVIKYSEKINIQKCNYLQTALVLFSPILAPLSFVCFIFILLLVIILNLFYFSIHLNQKYVLQLNPTKRKLSRDIEMGLENDLEDYLSIIIEN